MEHETQSAVIEYLQLKGYFYWRNNSGALKTERGGFIRFGSVGSPDVFVLKKGILYGLEIKSLKGKLSEGQIEFKKGMEKHGGKYFIIRSLDDLVLIGL